MKTIYTKNEPGEISKTNPENKNYGNADLIVKDTDLISIIPFTKDEEYQIEIGKDTKIFLKVIEKETSANEESLINEELTKDDLKIIKILDITLYKQVGDNTPLAIEKTNKKVQIVIDIPEEYINKDSSIIRTFKIIKIHDGKTSIITPEEKDGKLYFETDEFSTYVITYEDKTITKTNNTINNKTIRTEANTPKTGDNIIIYILVLIYSIIMLIIRTILSICILCSIYMNKEELTISINN